MKSKLIPVEKTYPLRNLVLRTGMPIETCMFKGDELETTFHLSLDDKCIVSYYLTSNVIYQEEVQYQLRGMATHPDYQGSGLGKQIVLDSIDVLKQKGCQRLWCNARTSAQIFYEKLGFSLDSEVFDIPTVGPHVHMSLVLG
jgi:predicted GNAT family N-acyltransferase